MYLMNKNVVFAVTAFIGCLHVAALDVAPFKDAAEFRRVGTLVPRSSPDPVDDQWMIGCEVLDRDFAKFSAYKDYLPQLGIRSIRLQGGWAKCEKEKGKYDFSWLDEPVNFALAHGMNPVLETDYGNPIYKGGGGPLSLRPITAIPSTRAAADTTWLRVSRTAKRALRRGIAGSTRCRAISPVECATG